MWTLIGVAAVLSVAAALIAVGYAWHEFRPLTDEERARMQGRRVGLIMSGQNIDRAVMCEVLAGRVPGQGAGVRSQASGRLESTEPPAPGS